MYSTVMSNKCGSKAYILSVVALDVHVDYAHKDPDDDSHEPMMIPAGEAVLYNKLMNKGNEIKIFNDLLCKQSKYSNIAKLTLCHM